MFKFQKYFLLAALLFYAVPIFSKIVFEKTVYASVSYDDHEEYTTIIIILDDKRIGYITYAIDRYDLDGNIIPHKQYSKATSAQCRAYIKFILIDDEYQKQGFGTTLILEAFKDMQRKKCILVSLLSKAQAIGFYEKIGFITDAQEVQECMEHFQTDAYKPMRYIFSKN